MGLKVDVLEITEENILNLVDFFNNLEAEKKTFRYFETRDFEIINNHVYTGILFFEGEPAVYGHLDKENQNVWLGIIVKSKFQGKGLSKIMMEILINKAKEADLKEVVLAVDKTNKIAYQLYLNFGFERLSNNENSYILKKTI